MPRVTTEIANAIMTPKEGHVPRATTARPKPFVVTSVVTKRYTPTTRKTPLQKLPLRIPPQKPNKERPSVPRWASTNLTSRPGSFPTVVQKVEPRRVSESSKPMPVPAPKKTTTVHKASPLRLGPSRERSLPEKPSVAKPLKMVLRVKEGKLVGGRPTSVPARSTQPTTANELPPRPSCVPRALVYRPSVSVIGASRDKQAVAARVSTAGPRNPGARQKPSVNTGTAKTAGGVKTTDAFSKKPVAAGDCRTGAVRNRRLMAPIAYPHAVVPAFDVAWSPPASPDLSSFPSQSWTIVIDVDVNQIKTPTKICCDETFSSTRDAVGLSGAGKPKDSCERSESISCSPASSSSPTVIGTPEGQAEPEIGSDGMVKISSPTKESCTEVSHTICVATMISPSRGTTSSMATLAKVMDGSQASSPAKVSDTGNGARMMVRRVAEMARTFFSPSLRTSQSGPGTASSETMGTDVSRIRKVFMPPLDKDAKASKNPTTQTEIEMLRARRMVAGGGMFDPRLPRIGSLAAMAIANKTGASSSDSPCQV